MGYGLELVTAPTGEAISLETARIHLRLASGAEDQYLRELLIPAAVERAQLETGRQLLTAAWRLTVPRFPRGAILLPLGRVAAVTSIEYVDAAGDDQTLDEAAYRLDASQEPALVAAIDAWPTTDARRNEAVRVVYQVGYGATEASIPPLLRSGILLALGHLYENRQEVITGTIATDLPNSAAAIFAQFRLGDEFHEYGRGWAAPWWLRDGAAP